MATSLTNNPTTKPAHRAAFALMMFLGAYFLTATPILLLFGFQGLIFLIPLIAAIAAGGYAWVHADDMSRVHAQVRRMVPESESYTAEGCYINELSNLDTDPDASIARARVCPGVSTRWHRLAGTTERYVILSGAGKVAVGNLAAQTVSPGDVVLIPPGCRQRITCLGDEDLVFLAVCTPRFRPEAYEDIDPDSMPTGPATGS